MCDALSHDIPATYDTIVCNCLSHGFRKFDELQAFYPEHCLPIMKWLSIPFKTDEESKQLGHDEEQRLVYHQKHSLPAMLEVKEPKAWLPWNYEHTLALLESTQAA